jgi:hypothetical protein
MGSGFDDLTAPSFEMTILERPAGSPFGRVPRLACSVSSHAHLAGRDLKPCGNQTAFRQMSIRLS